MSISNVSQANSYFHNASQALQKVEWGTSVGADSLFQRHQFAVQQKSLPYVIGERVIRPLIDKAQSIISRLFAIATSIDKSLSLPMVSAQVTGEVSGEIIKGIQAILYHNAASCTGSSTVGYHQLASSGSHKMSSDMNDLMNEVRQAYLEFEVGKYLKGLGETSLINTIFTDSEKDIIYNGPLVWREAPKSEVGDWTQGIVEFSRKVKRWSENQGYAGGFPIFEAGVDGVGVKMFKKGTSLWMNAPKSVVGDWHKGVEFYRKVNQWANDQGFPGGFPSFEAGVDVFGVKTFKKGTVLWMDAPKSEVGDWSKGLVEFCRKVNRWANTQGYAGGLPTFEEGASVVGVHLFPKA